MTEPATKGGQRLFSLIREAGAGLNYVSETDAPVEPFFAAAMGEVSAEKLHKIVDQGLKVEDISFEEFFGRLTEPKPWYTPEQRKNAQRFARLRDLLERELRGIHVFRVGRVRVDIYAIGADPEGNWLGVRTRAVET